MEHGPGLLEPFLSQIRMSVRGWGRIMGLGSAVLGLGSGKIASKVLIVEVGRLMCINWR